MASNRSECTRVLLPPSADYDRQYQLNLQQRYDQLLKECNRLAALNVEMLSVLYAIDRTHHESPRTKVGLYGFPDYGPVAERLKRVLRLAEGKEP